MIWQILTIAIVCLFIGWIIINRMDKKNLNKLRSEYENGRQTESGLREGKPVVKESAGHIIPSREL